MIYTKEKVAITHFVKDKREGNLKKIFKKLFGSYIQIAQDKLERRAGSINQNQFVLQQERLWLKSLTWGLIATTILGAGWLAIARTEEVVVAKGKLEPEGNVKNLQIPSGAIVKEILIASIDRNRNFLAP